jgi:tetratricopeptide (TPR) repeat protein
MSKAVAFFGLLALLALTGCSVKQPALSPQTKAFEEEDAYALFALDAEAHGRYTAAAQYYALLYEKAPRVAYRDHFFENLLRAKQYDDVLKNAEEMQKTFGYDAQVERYRIRALVGKGELVEAEKDALALLAKTKAKQDYVGVADIYGMQKQYNTALRYLESAYDIDYDESVLDRMAVMMYVNLDRKKDAIALLETHIRMNGCSERICKRLAGFYSEQNNIDGMLSTYLRLYDVRPSKEVSDAIVRIYSYKNDLVHLKQFLEEYHTDDVLLLKLYINAKKYAKASALAQKLYEQSGDASYLGQSAIFAFEGAEDKNDPALIASVVQKLKTAVKSEKDPLLLNYLGYLLIDNDIDPKAGMAYVREALEQEPDSPFYLDSLAWGYYKLGRCKEADAVMKKVLKAMQGEQDDELDKHLKAIGECLKQQQGKQ